MWVADVKPFHRYERPTFATSWKRSSYRLPVGLDVGPADVPNAVSPVFLLCWTAKHFMGRMMHGPGNTEVVTRTELDSQEMKRRQQFADTSSCSPGFSGEEKHEEETRPAE